MVYKTLDNWESPRSNLYKYLSWDFRLESFQNTCGWGDMFFLLRNNAHLCRVTWRLEMCMGSHLAL
jgi:hypothetical protein